MTEVDDQADVASDDDENDDVALSLRDKFSPSVENWTEEEQHMLETALAMSTRTGKAKWDAIAFHVGKTRKECIDRYKYCVELVKKQKNSE